MSAIELPKICAVWAHAVGETHEDARKLPGYMDELGNIVAFKDFVQYIGPPVAYYERYHEVDYIRRYVYATSGWQSDDPAKIVARVAELGERMRETGAHTIVWREKPHFVKSDDGKYRFYCRFHVLPYVRLQYGKREGEEFPEA